MNQIVLKSIKKKHNTKTSLFSFKAHQNIPFEEYLNHISAQLSPIDVIRFPVQIKNLNPFSKGARSNPKLSESRL